MHSFFIACISCDLLEIRVGIEKGVTKELLQWGSREPILIAGLSFHCRIAAEKHHCALCTENHRCVCWGKSSLLCLCCALESKCLLPNNPGLICHNSQFLWAWWIWSSDGVSGWGIFKGWCAWPREFLCLYLLAVLPPFSSYLIGL